MRALASLPALLIAVSAHGQGVDIASMDELRAAFTRGYNAGSIETLGPLNAPGAVRMMYDTRPQAGRAQIVEALGRSFAQRRRTEVRLTLQVDELHVTADTLAVERGRYHEVWLPLNGATPYVETGTYVTLARDSSGWRYLWSIFNRDSVPGAARVALRVLTGDSVTGATWRPIGTGLDLAVLHGDPATPDQPYAVALRLVDGRWILPHRHPRAKQVNVLSGTLRFGHGERFDTANTTSLLPGTIAVVPGHHAHFEGARGETIILLSGIGPLQTTFVAGNPRLPAPRE